MEDIIYVEILACMLNVDGFCKLLGYFHIHILTYWGSQVAQRSKALHLNARDVPGSNPGCIISGRDWESHRAAHNCPSVVRVWPGVGRHCK